MADTRPFLVRALEQVKRFADNPASTRGLQETQLLEDIRRAHAGIYEDLAAAIGPEAEFFHALFTLTLTEDQEWARLPGAYRKFLSLNQYDSTGKIRLRRRKHTPGRDPNDKGVALMPDIRRMRFLPVVIAAEAGDWELAFESGPIELHYGNPQPVITLTGATFTNATKTLSKTGAFASYTYKAGDICKVTGGTGVTTGRYAIASKVDGDAITLTSDIGGSNPTDVAGEIYKIDRIVFTSSPTKGQLYPADHYYVGARVYVVSGYGIDEVAGVASYSAATREAVLSDNLLEVPDSASVYEIRPWVPGRPDQFDEIVSWRAALKYRRIRGDDAPGEGAAHREIKHLRSECIRFIVDQSVQKAPAIPQSRPYRSRAIWSR